MDTLPHPKGGVPLATSCPSELSRKRPKKVREAGPRDPGSHPVWTAWASATQWVLAVL